MKKIVAKSKSKKRTQKKPAGTDFDALIKSVWKIHKTFGYKFTEENLAKARKSLWG